MNKYIIDLASSFIKVGQENYNWIALNKNGEDYIQEAENNFSSEIVRHFRNLMDETGNTEYYRAKGLFCHFDIRKARVFIQPDIVLHSGQNNHDNQEFLCEVKITNTKLANDLEKLKTAISDELNFKYAVMIVVNKPFNSTVCEIKEFCNLNNNINLNKLILFHSEIIDQMPIFYIANFSSINNI